jgi:hypothetical protein
MSEQGVAADAAGILVFRASTATLPAASAELARSENDFTEDSMSRTRFWSLVLVAVWMTVPSFEAPPENTGNAALNKPLATMWGRNSKIKHRKLVRITTAKDWQSLWFEHKTGSAKPKIVPIDLELLEVDFDKAMVIAVFEGEGVNCRGYSSHSISEVEGKFLIRLRAHTYQSGGDDSGTQAWGILVLPRSSKEVILQHDVKTLIGDRPKWEEWKRFPSLPKKKQ